MTEDTAPLFSARAARLAGLLLAAAVILHAGPAEGAPLDRLRGRNGSAEAGAESSVTGNRTISLKHAGKLRTCLVHVPPGYDPEKPAPLLLAFHGGGGNSSLMADDGSYGFISKADKEGFIAAFPNGASRFRGKLATWNAGRCCGYARDSGSDDVGFVSALLKELRSSLKIDPRRVYAVGMSNGGMFAYRLACDLPGEFRAVASVTGTDNYDGCSGKTPVSVLHIHAKDDGHVLFGGGAGPEAFRDRKQVTEFSSVRATIAKWVKRNGCEKKPVRVLEKEGVYCDLYSGCRGRAAVKLCVTESGGHSWPGARKKPRRKADTPSRSISATDEIWDFFSSLR